MARSLSRELGPRGITVNTVCPGWTETDIAMLNLDRMAELEEREPQDLLKEQLSVQSIKSLMKPEDIAGIYVFWPRSTQQALPDKQSTLIVGSCWADPRHHAAAKPVRC